MHSDPEIVVVGAGPAGSACASVLAEYGHDVCLIDKSAFPRDKACGDGLTPNAVSVLTRLGLASIVSDALPIVGCRVIIDHRRQHVIRYQSSAPGRCVRRKDLDSALVDAARTRGVPLLNARVRAVTATARHETAQLVVETDGTTSDLTASHVVACDGVTSALRNAIYPHDQHDAWAIRGYFATERRLDPYFDFYIPLEVEAMGLLGYGWVFPLDEHLANIGIGCYRRRGDVHAPSLQVAFGAFLDQLRIRSKGRFGEIERLDQSRGAPVGIRFNIGRCRRGCLLFAGDAAGTTDPFTGEGIAPALEGGELAARAVHASARCRDSLSKYSRDLARRMPRAGQNLTVIARALERISAKEQYPSVATIKRLRYLSSGLAMAAEINTSPDPAASPVASLLRDCAPPAYDHYVTHLHVLDALRTPFPLAAPRLAQEIQSSDGPIYAATVLLTIHACGGEFDDQAILGARAAEYLAPFATMLSELVDSPSRDLDKLNNALAVLAADFAVSRSMIAAAGLGPELTIELARTARRICVGGMLDVSARYNLDRTQEGYIGAIEQRIASVFEFASVHAAKLCGIPEDAAYRVREYAHDIGIAYTLATDIATVTESLTSLLSESIRGGVYRLPLLLALQGDERLRKDIIRGPASPDVADILERLRAADVLDRVGDVMHRYLGSARLALTRADVPQTPVLVAFVDWIEARARSGRDRDVADTKGLLVPSPHSRPATDACR